MNIEVLASSSSGNAYLISNGESRLLLDAGLRFSVLQEKLEYKVAGLDGALITHEHQDHCRAVEKLMRSGVDCYMSKGTAEAIGAHGHRLHYVSHNNKFLVGPWTVLPFNTKHDAVEPLGFVVYWGTEKLLYLTDTAYTQYLFDNLTHIMIEANYDENILRENVANGVIAKEHKRRVYESHLSIERVIEFLKANDLSRLKEIHLLHLSDGASDAIAFKMTLERATGVPVYIADK